MVRRHRQPQIRTNQIDNATFKISNPSDFFKMMKNVYYTTTMWTILTSHWHTEDILVCCSHTVCLANCNFSILFYPTTPFLLCKYYRCVPFLLGISFSLAEQDDIIFHVPLLDTQTPPVPQILVIVITHRKKTLTKCHSGKDIIQPNCTTTEYYLLFHKKIDALKKKKK